MTQIERARQGIITEEMKFCAERDGVDAEFVRTGVAEGTIVVVRNRKHRNVLPLTIDPVKADGFFGRSDSTDNEGCTMCGEFCAIRFGRREQSAEGRV